MKARRDCNCPCHSGQWIHVVPCCEDRPLAGLATRLNRLGTSTGLNVVAIGIVASALSLVMFTIQDLLTLLTGKFVAFHGPKGIWYVVLAILAALFCAMNVFVLRPVYRGSWPCCSLSRWLRTFSNSLLLCQRNS
jgi:hypothetical protein